MGIEIKPRRFNNFIISTILKLIKNKSDISLSLSSLKHAIVRKYISGTFLKHNQQIGIRYQR